MMRKRIIKTVPVTIKGTAVEITKILGKREQFNRTNKKEAFNNLFKTTI